MNASFVGVKADLGAHLLGSEYASLALASLASHTHIPAPKDSDWPVTEDSLLRALAPHTHRAAQADDSALRSVALYTHVAPPGDSDRPCRRGLL